MNTHDGLDATEFYCPQLVEPLAANRTEKPFRRQLADCQPVLP
ncbi:hypothetical protein BURKHO8Y_140573 [Burkholderia sp. 8Y]|nr:hypothetical protein BURKHO8Y_140573 [Burkholderia sp. 8Y]